jgi:type VI secretion system ImpA family protein
MDSLVNRDFLFDIGKLLIPISPDNPSGESLRYDALYDQIREGRREDDAVQERGVWSMALKKADWAVVEKLCIQALAERSKDLQIAAWLLEAWLRLYGLAGLREGFRLLTALCQDFWETLHPLPEDGDLEYRVAPFEWVNDKVTVVLKMIPITNPQGDNPHPYSWADWETACRPAGAPQTYRGKPMDLKLTQEEFQESVTQTSAGDLRVLLELTDGAIHSLNLLTATLDEKCGDHSPGLGKFSSSLSSIRGLLFTSYSQRPESHPTTPEKTMDTDDPSMPVDPSLQTPDEAIESGALSVGPIRSRAEAYRRLAEAADYLIKTEPHSPVPYLVKRAIGWGGMNLQDLLPELVRNNSELSEIYRLLQFGRPE